MNFELYKTRIGGEMIVVWFSCGCASAVAAMLAVEKYDNVRVVYNPVAEEHPDNMRFLQDIEIYLGKKIEIAANPAFPDASAKTVWAKRKFMSSPQGAPCTVELKKAARQIWEKENNPDYHILGFTSDEKSRYDRFVLTERSNVIPILIDAGMTKQDCYDYLLERKIRPPIIYDLGFPNANCIGCVKATSPTYWNLVRKQFPHIYEDRAKQSREIGSRLVRHKGERIFLDELPENAKGRDIKTMNIDCGIFCEETPTQTGEKDE